MMRAYARIDGGVVAELLSTDGNMAEMFHPDLIWVDITDADPKPQQGWLFDGNGFFPPPGPTPEQVLAVNTATRDALMRVAAASIAPLQDAVDLNMATAQEVADLDNWKRYRIALSRLDLSGASVTWPEAPSV